jgi:hypothetical protein
MQFNFTLGRLQPFNFDLSECHKLDLEQSFMHAFLLTVMCNPRCVPYVTYRTTVLYHVYLQHSSYNIVLLIYTALLSTHIEIQANMTIRVQGCFFLQILHKTHKSGFLCLQTSTFFCGCLWTWKP